MDPLAHTLVGAALAETGLKKLTRFATPVLLIGANLPDIDGITSLLGEDASLYYRRGWTHGILALILLPLLLAGAFWLWHRCLGGPRGSDPPPRLKAMLGLSFLAVWSHPLLDWLNTYGIRLLMPFDGRWFYGDTLFIVDPWVWLLAGSGVVLAWSSSAAAIVGWLLLGILTTALIMMTEVAPSAVKALWLAGVSAILGVRLFKPATDTARTATRAGFATLVLYVTVVYALARVAESSALRDYPDAIAVQSNPLPGRPAEHRLVLVHEGFYRVLEADGEVYEVPRLTPGPVVRAAMSDPSIRGFINWMRHPYWEVADLGSSWRVTFRDLRYLGPDDGLGAGIGFAQVDVPKQAVENPEFQ